MANLAFVDIYNLASRWAGDTTTTGISRAKDAVAEANKILSYGLQLPALKPWWRQREDTITPVSGTQAYAWPNNKGSFDTLQHVWYEINGTEFDIKIVDDQTWADEVIDKTTITGTPEICNIFSDGANTYKLRFSVIPGSSFISTADNGKINVAGYIQETLEASSGDSIEPLMPNSRRMGIAWKAVELLASRQGDAALRDWAAVQGKRYYEMIFNDDATRLGFRTKQFRPIAPFGQDFGQGSVSDYGHLRP